MFQEDGAVFANVDPDYDPRQQGAPALPSQARVPAMPGHTTGIGIQGMGASPDGIGQTGMAGPGQMGAMQWEPQDTSPEAAVRSAGVTTLAVALAFGTGLALGGWKGGVAGILLTGGAFNVYRAQKWWGSADAGEKHEAVVSAIMATAGLGAGGYSAYKAFEDKKKGGGE